MTCCLSVLSGKQKAEWLLRWAMGLFLFMAGIGKLMGGVAMFANKMAPGFEETFLPMMLVVGFFTIVPFIEILLGSLLLVGIWRECTLWATGVLFIIFIFGHKLMGDMGAMSSLMIYLMVVAGALSLPAAWEIGCCHKCEK